MSSVKGNINSYDAGGKSYQHDTERGKWKSISEFYFSCIGHGLGLKSFTILPLFLGQIGIFFIIPITLGLFLFSIPVFIFQSFLGQFSGTGFISAYRISPLFKGIAYVVLILNVTATCYYSAIAAYPLTYFFASFSPDLPWMSCKNSFNTPVCVDNVTREDNATEFFIHYEHWKAMEYFEYRIANFQHDNEYEIETTTKIAWPIFFCTILIWILIGAIFWKGFEWIRQIIRWGTFTSIAMFSLFFIRVLCIPGAMHSILKFFIPHEYSFYEAVTMTPFLSMFIFGSGWGVILTMASYNHFKADIIHYSTSIGLLLAALYGFASLTIIICSDYLYDEILMNGYVYSYYALLGQIMVIMPSVIGTFEIANFWSMLFFSMLFLCEFCGILIQILTITTAIFDEYESLRQNKQRITLGIISSLGLLSLFFTTNQEVFFFNVFTSLSTLTQMCICFLELIIVVWIYGRTRFQRDVNFMLGRTFSTWKFFTIRFITPLFIIFNILICLAVSVYTAELYTYFSPDIVELILLFMVKIFPWLFIPVYIVYKLMNTTGKWYNRFKKSVWPTDWYPADPLMKELYEKSMGTSDISQQLIFVKSDEEDDDDDNGGQIHANGTNNVNFVY